MPVVVVYAAGSKLVRRVYVSDTKKEISDVVRLAPGENALAVPFEQYTKLNATQIAAWVADQVGPPEHDGRCVEVDGDGKVVAVLAADPALDKPIKDKNNTLEVHGWAEVGDQKLNGIFPPKPVPVDDGPDDAQAMAE